MAFAAIQLLNGLSFSALLLLLSLGLSVVLSLMNFINLSHGAFFLLGAQVAVWALGAGWSPLPAFSLAFVTAAAAGAVLERFPFRRFYGRPHLMQVLLTFGVATVAVDLMRWSFGSGVRWPELPESLGGVVFLFELPFPLYRLFIIGVGAVLALLLHLLLDRTLAGALVRACVSDRGMVETLGLDARRVFSAVFVLSAGLGGLAGALGCGMLGAYPGLDEEVLVLALVTVVVGGLGTVRGTVAGALLVGLVSTFSKVWLPEFANVLAFGCFACILVLRPAGLVAPAGRVV